MEIVIANAVVVAVSIPFPREGYEEGVELGDGKKCSSLLFFFT